MFYTFVIARCAKRAVAIQLDCFVATLLAMTVYSSRDFGMSRPPPSDGKRYAATGCTPADFDFLVACKN
jgi:hypothetical protein